MISCGVHVLPCKGFYGSDHILLELLKSVSQKGDLTNDTISRHYSCRHPPSSQIRFFDGLSPPNSCNVVPSY